MDTSPSPSPRPPSGLGDRVRAIGPTVVLVVATLGFAAWCNHHYPVRQWLFWRYAGYWVACSFWGVACLALGDFVMKRLLPTPAPFREHLGTSFAIGVFGFYFAMTLAGLAHAFWWPLFFALPGAMLLLGGPGLLRTSRRFVRHVRAARLRARPTPPWQWLVLAFGLVAMGMVYFLILTPENIQFDSRWKHFALAEEYAVTGGIRRFPEGWTVETNPHLATFVYLWGFLLPFGRLFDRIELAAHLELTIFVATTLMIPALVRRLLPGASARHAWVARFIFPGVFLYDSSVSGGADHVAALFTVPLFILLLRAYRDLSPRACAAMSIVAAGGIMTKLTGTLMLLPVPVAVLAVRAVVLLVRRSPDRQNAWRGPLVALGVGLVATSTFWLKNWVYYGDPVYPSLHAYLTLRPWTAEAANLFEHGYKDFQFWRPTHDLNGVKETLKALLDFSFVPNDYPKLHGSVPVFGSMFTLLLACLPFLRKTRRVWALAGAVHLAIFVWYWTHHQDRYLQTLMPWMAAVTASIIILLVRTNRATRVALGGLVALQIVWGGDVYFIQTHSMVDSPIPAVVELLSGGYEKNYEKRYHPPGWAAVGDALPEGARVLLHDNHTHLGVHAETVSDWGGWQFGISYGAQKTPRQVFDLLTKMGVTHIAIDHATSKGWDSLAGDLMFFHFATLETVDEKKIGEVTLSAMPPAPPTRRFEDTVLFLGCDDAYRSGSYVVSDLTVPVFGPRHKRYPKPRVAAEADGSNENDLARKASFLVLDPSCHPDVPSDVTDQFEQVATRKLVRGKPGKDEWTLWLRVKRAAAP